MTSNRWRWFRRLCLLIAGILIAGFGSAGLVLSGQSLHRWMRMSPRFAVADIVVSGNDVVGEAEIISLSGIARGENIFGVDPLDAQERLQRDQRFEDVFVRRAMPGRIYIYLNERKPVALVQLDRMYGVDYNGELLPAPPLDRMAGLPVITGILPEHNEIAKAFAEGRVTFAAMSDSILYNAKVDRAIYLIEMIRAFAPEFVDRISEVHVNQIHDPVMYTTDTGTAVRLGIGHYPDKIKRLRQILERLQQDRIDTRWIDLRFDHQVIIRPILTADQADTTRS